MAASHSFLATGPPFAAGDQLYADRSNVPGTVPSVPGYPRVPLQSRSVVYDFLARDLWSADLDHMADKLWWMSKQDSSNISPLHRQLVKRRTIVVTEDPKLHLVWINDRIFVKPLPRYISSHAFWHDYLSGSNDAKDCPAHIPKAALGFLRTYAYLIQHELDLRIAQDTSLRLIPNDVTWEQFCAFAYRFNTITDCDVAPRYLYGEIRLTRLNWYAPLLLRKSHFQRVEYQYGSYFAQFYGSVLFVIGVVSVILSGLQVCVAVEQGGYGPAFPRLAFWFSIVMIIAFFLVFIIFFLLWAYKYIKEWRYAISRSPTFAGRRPD